jgi:hypothetical protein
MYLIPQLGIQPSGPLPPVTSPQRAPSCPHLLAARPRSAPPARHARTPAARCPSICCAKWPLKLLPTPCNPCPQMPSPTSTALSSQLPICSGSPVPSAAKAHECECLTTVLLSGTIACGTPLFVMPVVSRVWGARTLVYRSENSQPLVSGHRPLQAFHKMGYCKV